MNILYAMLGGFALDWLFGDPAWLTHPVVIMGKAISALERALRARLPKTPRGERLGGLTLAIVLPVGTLLLTGGDRARPGEHERLPPAGKGRPARGEKGGQPHCRPGHGEADARGRDESGGGDGRRKRERRRDRAAVLHDARRRAAGTDL